MAGGVVADELVTGSGVLLEIPAAGVLREHLLDYLVAVLAQRAHRRQRLELAEPAGEAVDLLVENLKRPRGLALARRDVARDDRLQIIDVVQADALELAASRVDVAWNGDVDQQQRPLAALA